MGIVITDGREIYGEKRSVSTSAEEKSPLDKDFIDWLTGFVEGDGSFAIDSTISRTTFTITQKERAILDYIKDTLDMGTICFAQQGHYKYNVSTKADVTRLIDIFNGKLRLEKCQLRFKAWTEAHGRYCNTPPVTLKKNSNTDYLFNSAWFSGFIDAEGCFDAPKSGKTRKLRFSFKQKFENSIYKFPDMMIRDKKIGRTCTSAGAELYTIGSKGDIVLLIDYLNTYNLKSKKLKSYQTWLLTKEAIDTKQHIEDIHRLAMSINKH